MDIINQENGASITPPVSTSQKEDLSVNSFEIPKKRNKTILALIFLVLLIIVSIVTLIFSRQSTEMRSKASVSGPELSIIPASKTLTVEENATVNVMLNTKSTNVSAVQIKISYDTTAIDQVSFIPGTIFPIILDPPLVNNGFVTVTLGVEPKNPASPFNGSGIVGKLKFSAKSQGTSSIGFSDSTAVAVLGKNTNALESTKGTQIIISTVTPTITTTPTTTPTPTSTVTPTLTTLNCNQKCTLKNTLVFSTCIELCNSINSGQSRCPTACDSVPTQFRNLCAKTLCSSN